MKFSISLKYYLISLFLLLSFGASAQSSENQKYVLTVESSDNTVVEFDLLIAGHNGDKANLTPEVTFFKSNKDDGNYPFHIKESSLKTPYKLELINGDYSIVIRTGAPKGSIISKVSSLIDGKSKAFASSPSSLSLLTINQKTLSASGM